MVLRGGYPGVDVKLSNVGEGEILIRSHMLLDRYFDNDEANREARDEEGYFETGDIGVKKGDYYFVLGRASIDIIKSGGYKIAAPDIEREIYGLPYVFEAMVVGVEDQEYGQRIAAAVVIQGQSFLSAGEALWCFLKPILFK
ncbi:uncharacterized protein A1O9_08647 [Exophiala aquamarina CBS 119918]|uniref:AMP-binding enzyme C-terminal domain-containing protein n=1 Tax=Exophiala aquamarina CBS 119918 TaxID=1182545 RepID=A0A072PHH5_9EURO|nr:uncharacterized protein A1O9_08647 [Exophiala aquamarina CBS 119918]KEF54995.1 hypothetical protein A1O9_08647 [Exophiala aquamarina CBS 119918]